MQKIDDLLAIMARLRDPDNGCPWDVKQSFETIVPYTIKEAYEVADAVDRRDYADLCDELGDLLFATVNLVRHLGKDPEQVLRGANANFERHSRQVEQFIAAEGLKMTDCTLEKLDAAWCRAKETEQS